MGHNVSRVLSLWVPHLLSGLPLKKTPYSVNFKFDCDKQKTQKDSVFLLQVNV